MGPSLQRDENERLLHGRLGLWLRYRVVIFRFQALHRNDGATCRLPRPLALVPRVGLESDDYGSIQTLDWLLG